MADSRAYELRSNWQAWTAFMQRVRGATSLDDFRVARYRLWASVDEKVVPVSSAVLGQLEEDLNTDFLRVRRGTQGLLRGRYGT